MKKTSFVFTALILGMLGCGFAQDFKPAAGAHNLEVQFAPLGEAPIRVPGIRYRHFLSPTLAVRTTVLVNYFRDPEIIRQANPDNDVEELRDMDTDFRFFLNPGIEKHLAGTDRLSPYFGAELTLGMSSSSYRLEFEDFASSDIYFIRSRTRFFTLGFNAVAGADFYLSPQLYMGIEFGYGFFFDSPIVERVRSNDPDFEEDENPDREAGSSGFGLVNGLGQIRLGYFF